MCTRVQWRNPRSKNSFQKAVQSVRSTNTIKNTRLNAERGERAFKYFTTRGRGASYGGNLFETGTSSS